MSPRTPRTPEPGRPHLRELLHDDPTEGDDGALHHFWAFLIRRRLMQPSDNDTLGWLELLELFDHEEGQ
jgi:hypothetical protein